MKKFIVAACFVAFVASPAFAGWDYAQWGMTPKQVAQTSGGRVTIVADKKDQRVHDTPHLAQGTAELDGVQVETDYYFAKKTKALVMVDVVPLDDTSCPKVEAAFVSRFGEGTVERKSLKLRADRPPLESLNRNAIDPKSGDKVSYLQLTVEGMGFLHCKILLRSAAYKVEKDW